MKTEQILLALAIRREGSVSKAARTIFVSQPTASNMLRSLEDELGYALFRRARAGMVPTDEGGEFLEYARAIERSLAGIAEIGKATRRIDFKVVSAKYDFAEQAFERLCEASLALGCPVDMSYQVVSDTERAMAMVGRAECDVAIALVRKNLIESHAREAASRGFETQAVADLHLEISCRAGHPLIEGGHINLDLLGRYPCLTSIPTSSSEHYIPRFLTSYGAAVKRTVAMDPSRARHRLLVTTEGYLVSTQLTEETKAAFGLESVPIPDSDLVVCAIFRQDSRKRDLIDDYVRLCRTLV